MVPFAGFEMPVQYTNLGAEHNSVRNKAGVFDVSHMGEFFVEGPGALELIQRLTSNDAAKLMPGKIQYSCLPNETGGIVDDLLVYCLGAERYMLVVNASNMEKDWNWISARNTGGVLLTNRSDEYSLLAVQGPEVAAMLQHLTTVPLAEMGYYTFAQGTFAGCADVIISATGYTGAGGFELYCLNGHAERIWDAVLAAGAVPAGLGARDTLRLEMGFCLYGNDIDDTTSPIEAGLGWITKFTKAFTNHESLKRQKEEGVSRKLVGLNILDKGPIARQGHDVVDEQGNVLGRVTSGTLSPTLGRAIAMAYVPAALAAEGSTVWVQVRNNRMKAEVCKFPFIAAR